MAHLVFVVGESGTGKSSSLRNLNPEETVIINTDQKALPFKKFKDRYNEDKGNYIQTSEISGVVKKLSEVNKDKSVSTVIIDTWSRLMTDKVMSDAFRNSKNGMQAWANMAADQYRLINIINDKMREDLIVYMFCHPYSVYDEMGEKMQKIGVQGKMLEKQVPESFSSIVLYTEVLKDDKNVKYKFLTQNNGTNTCKTPFEMFEDKYIDNDLLIVNEAINNYF